MKMFVCWFVFVGGKIKGLQGRFGILKISTILLRGKASRTSFSRGPVYPPRRLVQHPAALCI